MSPDIFPAPGADRPETRADAAVPGRRQLLETYLRLEDPVSRAYLRQGRNPADFEAVRKFFPVVRELGACRAPREWDRVADVQFFAYHAGHDLGCRHPGLLPDILPGAEARDTLRRLQVLHQCAGGGPLDGRGLKIAFCAVTESYRPDRPGVDPNAVAGELLLKSARSGYAAATAAAADPGFAEILAPSGRPHGGNFPAAFERALAAAPWRTHEEGWMALPPHPLLRLARELHPERSLEGETLSGFLMEQLQAWRVKSEGECPAGELDLLDWVRAGLDFGRRLKRRQPGRVAEIFAECGRRRLVSSRLDLMHVLGHGGKVCPVRLIRPMLQWYARLYQPGEPMFYGHRLGRVAAIAGFAVWIAWLTAGEKRGRAGKAPRRRATGTNPGRVPRQDPPSNPAQGGR